MAGRGKRSRTSRLEKTRTKILRPVEALLVTKAKNNDEHHSDKGEAASGNADAAPGAPVQAGKDETQGEAPAEAAKGEAPPADAPPEGPADAPPETTAEAQPAPTSEESLYAELIPPRALPATGADAAAAPPGLAPPGDSRSFRRHHGDGEEFCLIYRFHRELVVRRGPVGKYGECTVTDYPSERSAAHAYAHRCSELAAEGFFDLRE